MATKNGVCPYCEITRLQNRLFPVNPEASTVYCPHCMREINPKQAIDLYNEIIDKMVEKADNSLFVAVDPVLAYQQYADVLEVEPENSKALLGRILCLIYTSTIRKAYFTEANDLLSNISHKGSAGVETYVGFLKKINFALDEYDLALQKKLTFRGYFHDVDCIKVYFKRLTEIIKFKNDIYQKMVEIKKDYVSQKNEVFVDVLVHNIQEKDKFLKTPKYTVIGTGYKFKKINEDEAVVEELSEVITTKIYRYRQHTLNENDKKGKTLIKNQVFKDYTPIIRAKNVSIYFAFFFLLASGTATYVSFALKEKLGQIFFPLALAGSALLLVGFFVLLILHLVWKSILKKRKLRID